MRRFISLVISCLMLGWSTPSLAEVQLSFHSFNGSVLFGRYPHTFIVLEGALEDTGEVINENYGFTAKRISPAILRGPVEHDIISEELKHIERTNRHFTVMISDNEYHQIISLMKTWRDTQGKFYDLSSRNCIHFVGEIARIVGLNIEYPRGMLRRPKKWLNHITILNPQLEAPTIE